VVKTAKCLLVGSVEDHCGKSAMVLSLAQRLGSLGQSISYGKPLGTCLDAPNQRKMPSCPTTLDEDVRFLTEALELKAHQLQPTLLMLDQPTLQQRLQGKDKQDYPAALRQAYGQPSESDIVLVEGPGTLSEGFLFNLSLVEMAETLDCPILLVAPYEDLTSIDAILSAQKKLGDRLMGILFNDVPQRDIDLIQSDVKPYLEAQGIPVLGIVPHIDLLRSVSVDELVQRLDAQVLCGKDHQDLMVESLCIGAMNVNSALEYFRRGHNMAVVTGGDRADLQLAALETSTQCLILTGRVSPRDDIIARAEELEVPILSVDLDTLSTVELIEQAFRQVRFHEEIKAECVFRMSDDYLDIQRLAQLLELEMTAP
jgi:uncharacterized protein